MTVQQILLSNNIWVEVNNHAQQVITERFMGNYNTIEPLAKMPAYICYGRVNTAVGVIRKRITSIKPGDEAVVIPFESFRWLINDDAPLSLLYNDLKK